MNMERRNSSNWRKYKVIIAGAIGAILGILAYTNNWLG